VLGEERELRTWNILNLGAGVQSTTLYLMACDVKLWGPNLLDFAIFADTGDEPEEVYKHLAWLQSVGTVPIMIRSKGRLSEDLKRTGGRFASIPAFTKGKKVGKLRRQCSKEYKLDVIERAIRRDIIGLEPRQRIPKDVHVTQYFGISLDEGGRAWRIEKRAKNKIWTRVKFPLLALNMTRADCLNWLADKVPHRVPRSACVYCPFHNDAEWLRIKSNAADWELAVEVDEAMRKPGIILNRKMNQKLYLHRSCEPLTQITFNPKPSQREVQTNLAYSEECLGVCGV
jgi:hypothetical protein